MATARQKQAAARNLVKARAAKKRQGGKKPAGAVSISAIRARTPAQQAHYAKLGGRIASLPPTGPSSPFSHGGSNPYKIHPVTGTTTIRGGAPKSRSPRGKNTANNFWLVTASVPVSMGSANAIRQQRATNARKAR